MSQEQEDESVIDTAALRRHLGMSPEVAEAERISQLPPRGAIAVRETESPQELQTRAQIQTQVGLVLRSEMGAVRAVVNDLIHDIRTNTEALKMADVPLEQVANSHERAAASFEALRGEIASVAGRLAGVERVIDTAGLLRAQEGAEARFTRLADLLERTIQELVTLQGGALEAARAKLAIWDPREVRADTVALMDARDHADIIAQQVREKLRRYVELEVFSTEKNDHTVSLSERVTMLEQALGEARGAYETAVRFWEHRRHLDRPWWVRIGQKLRR